MEEGLLRVQGAQEPIADKWITLATIKFIGGLQTQRSAFASLDTRYNTKFLGGKPDALIAGLNVEISNKLTLQRRPGLLAYGTANVPAPTNIYSWQIATTSDILMVLDTETSGGDNSVTANGAVMRYSTTNSGIYFNKALGSATSLNPFAGAPKLSNFIDVVNTMYCGDGVDLFKVIGPNLLEQSNTFGSGAGTLFTTQAPWQDSQVFALTPGFTDPYGGTAAWELIWNTTGSTASIQQTVIPNYTPIAKNTFTFSVWLEQLGTPSVQDVDLTISDQNGVVNHVTVALTQSWAQYQVTATMNANSNQIIVKIGNPTTTSVMAIYGAQLEVGGPATTTQITTTKPQGVYLWGIQAPGGAPTVTASSAVVGTPWAPGTAYSSAILQLTAVTHSLGSGAYTGTIAGGAGNAYVGFSFLVQGFSNTANNGTFVCTASTLTTLTLANAGSITQTNQSGTATPSFTLTSVSAGSASAVYQGTFQGAGASLFAGYAITISGFANPTNNGTFYVNSGTSSSVTVANSFAVNETPLGTATGLVLGQAITDSNGNLEVVTHSGTSGNTAPTWSITRGGTTQDGVSSAFIVQTGSNQSSSNATTTVALTTNVTAGDSLLIFAAANCVGSSATFTPSDTLGNTFVPIQSTFSGPFGLWVSYVQSSLAGADTITGTIGGGSVGIWLGVVETSQMSSVDSSAVNNANSLASGNNVFLTGQVTTSTTHDLLVSFCMAVAGNHANTTQTSPVNMSEVLVSTDVVQNQGNMWIGVAYQFLNTITSATNPTWNNNFGAGGSRECGATVAFVAANTTTLIWTNYGAQGLTTAVGYEYYYAFINSQTGHVSNVSPISSSTGALSGNTVSISGVGMQNKPSGGYTQDPQVDKIGLYRNTSAGDIWYQLATFANPGTATAAGTWTYLDQTPDADLATTIFAPIGDLNSPPPAGMANMEFFAGRMWGSVGSFLYYATSADNASELNVQENGVSAESWEPTNYIPLNAKIVRTAAVGGGLLVCTVLDTWFVTGQNILTGGFNPQKLFVNHGLRSWHGLDIDGSSVYMYTSDRECLLLNPNSGTVEIGYPIGDLLESTFSPLNVYMVRHVSGSQDNAVYLADGSTEWFRLNPNQQGASMSGEQTPVWSPAANFTASIGGIGALASIETAPGTIQLIVGQTTVGPVLVRSLSTFTDNGTPYDWSATIGSILLATPGKLAETESITTELNNSFAAAATQCNVSVLLDEIAGAFESLPTSVNDPPQLNPSISVLSNRFYLSQGTVPPICRHIQIKLQGAHSSGLPVSTKDEILAISVRGALVAEAV